MFAIAITLLAFDIAVPAGSEDDLLCAVADEVQALTSRLTPSLAGYWS